MFICPTHCIWYVTNLASPGCVVSIWWCHVLCSSSLSVIISLEKCSDCWQADILECHLWHFGCQTTSGVSAVQCCCTETGYIVVEHQQLGFVYCRPYRFWIYPMSCFQQFRQFSARQLRSHCPTRCDVCCSMTQCDCSIDVCLGTPTPTLVLPSEDTSASHPTSTAWVTSLDASRNTHTSSSNHPDPSVTTQSGCSTSLCSTRQTNHPALHDSGETVSEFVSQRLTVLCLDDLFSCLGVMAVSGALAGYAVLLVVIVILVCMLCQKRKRETQLKGWYMHTEGRQLSL